MKVYSANVLQDCTLPVVNPRLNQSMRCADDP